MKAKGLVSIQFELHVNITRKYFENTVAQLGKHVVVFALLIFFNEIIEDIFRQLKIAAEKFGKWFLLSCKYKFRTLAQKGKPPKMLMPVVVLLMD